jgi:single-stranded DNA-specific DHH superfamily exonuclease
LKKIGIRYENDLGHPRFWPDLSPTEKTKLTSSLVTYSTSVKPDISITKLLKTQYLLVPFEQYPDIYDASDFSTMLNANGRLNHPSIGVACCLSRSNDIINRAIETSKQYVKKIDDGISWLLEGNKIDSYKGTLNAFYGDKYISELLVGVVCTILVNRERIDITKPIIGYADSDMDHYKISGRCTEDLVIKGVNLSRDIRKVCKNMELGNVGGGNPQAAGATIPKELIKSFLVQLAQKIKSISVEETPSKKGKKTKKKSKIQSSKKATKKSIHKEVEIKRKAEQELKKKKNQGLDSFFG